MVEDALLRKDKYVDELLCALSIIQHDCIEEVRDDWNNDLLMWMLIQNI